MAQETQQRVGVFLREVEVVDEDGELLRTEGDQ